MDDALSRKAMSDLRAIFSRLSLFEDGGLLVELQVWPTLLQEIKLKQLLNSSLAPHVKLIEDGKSSNFSFNFDGVLCCHGRYYVR